MDSALIEILRDIPQEEIHRVIQEGGYSRWTYFTDTEAGEAGIIYANDKSLALYDLGDDSKLKPGPLGVMKLRSIQYVPSAHGLYIVNSSQYLTLQVFSDTARAGQDTTTAQEWQAFFADHSVGIKTAETNVQPSSSRSYKLPGIVAAATAALIAVIAFVVTR